MVVNVPVLSKQIVFTSPATNAFYGSTPNIP